MSGDMKEVNELTRRLLAEGWKPEDTPPGTEPYKDYYGGWTYTSEAIRSTVWETPCGLLVAGSHFLNGYLSFNGVDWRVENGNPVVCCPVFPSTPCPLRDPGWSLNGMTCIRTMLYTNALVTERSAHIPMRAVLRRPTTRFGKSPTSCGRYLRPSTRAGYAVIRATMDEQQRAGLHVMTLWIAFT